MGCNCKETYNAQQRHQETCDYIHQELWLPKNAAYGDSFHELYKDLGIILGIKFLVGILFGYLIDFAI